MAVFNHMNDNPNNNKVKSSNESTFFIYAYYKKSKNTLTLFLNDITPFRNIIPFDCRLKEISLFLSSTDTNNENFLITLNVQIFRRSKSLSISNNFSSTENDHKQNIPINLDFKKNDVILIMIIKKNDGTIMTQNEGIFCLVFTK